MGCMDSSCKDHLRGRAVCCDQQYLPAVRSRVGIHRRHRHPVRAVLCRCEAAASCVVVSGSACAVVSCHGRTLSAVLRTSVSGYFQPNARQFGCISCDTHLGNFYQDLPGQTACKECPKHTIRYLGVLSALNGSACQCAEGRHIRIVCVRTGTLSLDDMQASSTHRACQGR